VNLVAEGTALDRTIAFSDAVFAIAMTILVLELHVPDVPPAQLPAQLLNLLPAYLTFVLSFVVVGVIWMSHHRKFGVIARFNQTLLRLNLVMLLLVVSLALPTAVLGRCGDQAIAVVTWGIARSRSVTTAGRTPGSCPIVTRKRSRTPTAVKPRPAPGRAYEPRATP
jgi:uncharacterized membrane protein